MIGAAGRALPAWTLRRSSAEAFAVELRLWDLAGFLYGVYIKTGINAAELDPCR